MEKIGEKKILRVLIACEESQAVCKEFRRLGHEAYSCDILPCSGGHPEWHLQQDVTELFKLYFDLMIAFPPCTHLAVSGARWFPEKIADGRQQDGINFFMQMINAPFKHIAVENPIGIMSKKYRKPDQIIQPYWFGDTSKKSTCLWLQNLPKLESTNMVEPDIYICKNGKKFSRDYMVALSSGQDSGHLRSKTYPGIAKAMANQWSEYILNYKPEPNLFNQITHFLRNSKNEITNTLNPLITKHHSFHQSNRL